MRYSSPLLHLRQVPKNARRNVKELVRLAKGGTGRLGTSYRNSLRASQIIHMLAEVTEDSLEESKVDLISYAPSRSSSTSLPSTFYCYKR